jgi:hypothetical protein
MNLIFALFETPLFSHLRTISNDEVHDFSKKLCLLSHLFLENVIKWGHAVA